MILTVDDFNELAPGDQQAVRKWVESQGLWLGSILEIKTRKMGTQATIVAKHMVEPSCRAHSVRACPAPMDASREVGASPGDVCIHVTTFHPTKSFPRLSTLTAGHGPA